MVNVKKLSKRTFLVLENNTLLRGVLFDVFRSFGVPTLLSTADPEIAFERFKACPVDIVISDCSSGLDGEAFLKRLREDPESPNPFVPVLMCMAESELRDLCETPGLGMTEYLPMSVSVAHIYTRIVSLIERNRQIGMPGGFFGPERWRHGGEYNFANGQRKAFIN